MRRLAGSAFRGLVLVGLLALYAGILSGRVSASGAPRPADAEACARVAVGEAGWDPSTGDAAAITNVLRRRAERRGTSIARMARLYSSGHFDRTRARRRWIAGLTLAASRPLGWPVQLAWRGDYRARWLAMVEHVRAVLRGDLPDPCGGEADHWGARSEALPDIHRARAAGWDELDCGDTANAFWRVPRRGGST